MKNIEFKNGLYGLRATIRTFWDDSFINILQEKKVMELELNVGKGWIRSDIEFLKNFSKLKSIIILDGGLESLTPLHYLTEIESMNISTYSKTPIDFNCFPELKKCGFEWIKGSESLFACKNLIGLGLNRYKGNSSNIFKNLENLEKLTLLNSNLEEIEGFSSLTKLNYLSLANLRNLISLKGIENLELLNELEIQKCKKLHSVNEVFGLKNLKKFFLIDSGDITSLKGIEKLHQLEMLMFYESTNILDGDLYPITKLSNLKDVSFKNRKHYTHKREDIIPN